MYVQINVIVAKLCILHEAITVESCVHGYIIAPAGRPGISIPHRPF